MTKNRYVTSAIAASGITVLYMLLQSTGKLLALSTDLLGLPLLGVSSFFAYRVMRQVGSTGSLVTTNKGFFMASILLFLTVLIWTVEDGLNVPQQSQTLAYAPLLIAYAVVVVVLMRFVWVLRENLTLRRKFTAIFLGAIIAALSTATLFMPLLESTASIVNKAFSIVSATLDTVMIILLMMIFLVFRGGTFSAGWRWYILGLLSIAISDVLVNVGQLSGWYYSGNLVDLFWPYGIILMILGLEAQRHSLTKLQP